MRPAKLIFAPARGIIFPCPEGSGQETMKRLIVNADDFGWSEAVTCGIIQGRREGILTSTTLMANLPGSEAALERARREAPDLAIGLHLVLTEGRPLAGRDAAWLTDPAGEFIRSLPALSRLVRTSTDAQEAVEAEWDAQVRWALERGLRPTHLDSHKHVHLMPVLLPIAVELALRYDIPAIRTTAEIKLAGLARLLPREWTWQDRLRQRLLAWMGRRWGRHAQQRVREAGLATTDWFFGVRATGGISPDVLLQLLRHAPEGTGELMVHPGLAETQPGRPTRLARSRPLELAALCDGRIREATREMGWTLVNFKDLHHE